MFLLEEKLINATQTDSQTKVSALVKSCTKLLLLHKIAMNWKIFWGSRPLSA
jgi:hypothetical protein